MKVVYCRYTYDNWGRLILSTNASGGSLGTGTLGYQNSVRYRGYVYDNETALYYLQSRYYDAETDRFLNADEVNYIGYTGEDISYNSFAYCVNNAVNYLDYSGHNSLNIVKLVNSVLKMLKPFNKVRYYLELSSYVKIERDSRTNFTKGIIRVDFTQITIDRWKYLMQKHKTISKDLTNIALHMFEDTFGRSFLFDEECVEIEIAQHLYGYINAIQNSWWAYPIKFNLHYAFQDYKKNGKFNDIKFNTIVSRVALACASADIYEADVYFNKYEALGFGYMNHIHSDYYKKSHKDPYYNSITKKRNFDNDMEEWLYVSL